MWYRVTNGNGRRTPDVALQPSRKKKAVRWGGGGGGLACGKRAVEAAADGGEFQEGGRGTGGGERGEGGARG